MLIYTVAININNKQWHCIIMGTHIMLTIMLLLWCKTTVDFPGHKFYKYIWCTISFAAADKLAIQMVSIWYTSSHTVCMVQLFMIHHSDVVYAVYKSTYSYILFKREQLQVNVTAE